MIPHGSNCGSQAGGIQKDFKSHVPDNTTTLWLSPKGSANEILPGEITLSDTLETTVFLPPTINQGISRKPFLACSSFSTSRSPDGVHRMQCFDSSPPPHPAAVFL